MASFKAKQLFGVGNLDETTVRSSSLWAGLRCIIVVSFYRCTVPRVCCGTLDSRDTLKAGHPMLSRTASAAHAGTHRSYCFVVDRA